MVNGKWIGKYTTVWFLLSIKCCSIPGSIQSLFIVYSIFNHVCDFQCVQLPIIINFYFHEIILQFLEWYTFIPWSMDDVSPCGPLLLFIFNWFILQPMHWAMDNGQWLTNWIVCPSFDMVSLFNRILSLSIKWKIKMLKWNTENKYSNIILNIYQVFPFFNIPNRFGNHFVDTELWLTAGFVIIRIDALKHNPNWLVLTKIRTKFGLHIDMLMCAMSRMNRYESVADPNTRFNIINE